jgi:hypothetical protein
MVLEKRGMLAPAGAPTENGQAEQPARKESSSRSKQPVAASE